MPWGTSTSMTTMMKSPWTRTVRLDLQVRTCTFHCFVKMQLLNCLDCPCSHRSVPSPTRAQLHADEPGCLPQHFGPVRVNPSNFQCGHSLLQQWLQQFVSSSQDLSQLFLSPMLSAVPPPPPPLPPVPDELDPPPKPPFADEEEEEEMLLRETCLMSMANKRVAVTEVRISVFLCCLTSTLV